MFLFVLLRDVHPFVVYRPKAGLTEHTPNAICRAGSRNDEAQEDGSRAFQAPRFAVQATGSHNSCRGRGDAVVTKLPRYLLFSLAHAPWWNPSAVNQALCPAA